ncbi:group II intron reverse transcriptase/maturase [Priestia megaterium]|uniref:group II intron reverse transcriptase/maturase n=1 Tax=Priestia megaterium TaxID=1404 RepID=UPI003101ACEE
MPTKSNTLPKEDTSIKPEQSSPLDSKPSVPITPTTDRALKEKLDYFYSKTKSEMNDEETPWQLKGFKSLLEVIESEPVIVQALEKLKRNDGSMTAGVDKKTLRDFLELPFNELVEFVRKSLRNYHPEQVRRVWIDKPGKKEKRPLGIPTIGDRIIQECVRIVIEPILEAQFWDHSYGFRPYRDTHQAYARTVDIIYKTGCFWVVEGDISKFFDKVNHTTLLKKLYAMGIRDKRVLMLIKQMLKAGVMSEATRNELGTPQGGIISPLLANAYLHSLDKWITREWEEKKLQVPYKSKDIERKTLRNKTNQKPAYFIRYADDWLLVTNTKENAEKWKWRISQFLKRQLKLELSEEKTLITNVTQKSVKFLGFEIKFVKKYDTKTLREKGQKTGNHGYVVQSKPDAERLKSKMQHLRKQIKQIRRRKTKAEAVHQINVVNSTIIGLHNYYNVTTLVNPVFMKYAKPIWITARRSTIELKSFLIDANKTDNLTMKHEDYRTEVVAIKNEGQIIGITSVGFVKTKIKDTNSMIKALKNQNETPFTMKGRKLYYERSGKRPMAEREDEVLSLDLSLLFTQKERKNPKRNTEFFCNRGRAFNVAKGKCQCCKRVVGKLLAFHTHHKEPYLPLDKVNKTNKLAIVCKVCHSLIHNNKDYPELSYWVDKNGFERITKLRNLLKKQPNPNSKRKTKAKKA